MIEWIIDLLIYLFIDRYKPGGNPRSFQTLDNLNLTWSSKHAGGDPPPSFQRVDNLVVVCLPKHTGGKPPSISNI